MLLLHLGIQQWEGEREREIVCRVMLLTEKKQHSERRGWNWQWWPFHACTWESERRRISELAICKGSVSSLPFFLRVCWSLGTVVTLCATPSTNKQEIKTNDCIMSREESMVFGELIANNLYWLDIYWLRDRYWIIMLRRFGSSQVKAWEERAHLDVLYWECVLKPNLGECRINHTWRCAWWQVNSDVQVPCICFYAFFDIPSGLNHTYLFKGMCWDLIDLEINIICIHQSLEKEPFVP